MQRKWPIVNLFYRSETAKNRTFRADVGIGPYEYIQSVHSCNFCNSGSFFGSFVIG